MTVLLVVSDVDLKPEDISRLQFMLKSEHLSVIPVVSIGNSDSRIIHTENPFEFLEDRFHREFNFEMLKLEPEGFTPSFEKPLSYQAQQRTLPKFLRPKHRKGR